MDLQLSEEQRMIQKMARDFADNVVAPQAAESDEQAALPMDIIRQLSDQGFLGLTVSEEYGGSGLDTVSYVLAVGEISRACAATSVVMAVQNSLVNAILQTFGTEEQKARYLPRLATGKWIGAFALTEPEAGSDVSAVATTAVQEGDEYVVNGTKAFITNGGSANLVILFASTDRSQGARGLTALVVESTTAGFSVGKEEQKMGIRASSTSELVCTDCRVPISQRLGDEGQGFKMAMMALDGGRISIAAQATGISQAAYEASLRYAGSRKQFGRPIAEFQAIQWMLADMATRIQASRLLTLDAALKKDAGERHTKEAAMCKLFASETAAWVTNRAIQIHGGYGYMKEYPLERFYRDAKVTEIYEGTSEIMRLVIANQILHDAAKQ